MRKFLISCLLLFSSTITQAITLKWMDTNDRCSYRINTENKILEKETKPDNWQAVGNIDLKNIDEKEILPSNNIICLSPPDKNVRYLLVDCTHQIYQLDLEKMSLERIDMTYYRGYNCESVRFIRYNTIYSIGGYGLFRTNNLLVYFKNETKEWDAINCLNDPPKSIHKGLNGYLKEHDIFFSGLNFYYSDAENNGNFVNDFGMYAYNFNENKWSTLGKIKNSILKKIAENPHRSFHWSGKYFVIRIYETPMNKIFIIDPSENEVFQWEDKKRLFDPQVPGEDKEYIIGDSLYTSKMVKTANQNYIAKQVFSLEQLKKEAKYVGKVYESFSSTYFILSAILVTLISSGLFYVRKIKSKKEEPILSEKFDSTEKILLNTLIQSHNEKGVDTEQINTILQINNKTIENQRKVRHDFMKVLTSKLELIYGIEEPIEKIPSALDKRIFNYKLNDNLLKKMINKTP